MDVFVTTKFNVYIAHEGDVENLISFRVHLITLYTLCLNCIASLHSLEDDMKKMEGVKGRKGTRNIFTLKRKVLRFFDDMKTSSERVLFLSTTLHKTHTHMR